MARTGTRRPFDEGDLAIARDLGLRAALAVDSARLYRAAQRATRERDVVLGVVSHDLRNPLSAIAMCATVLRESPPESAPERRVLADTIHESAEWMQRLMRDLLDVAAIEAGGLSLERREEDVGAIMRRGIQRSRGRYTNVLVAPPAAVLNGRHQSRLDDRHGTPGRRVRL